MRSKYKKIWTPDVTHKIVDDVMEDSFRGAGMSGLKADANTAQAHLLAAIEGIEADWSPEQIGNLAMAAVLEQMAEFCKQAAEWAVKDAREAGVSWTEVARATGYASAQSANRRFDPEKREFYADQQRERRARERK